MNLKVKRLHPDAKLPNYAHEGDVGMDVCSLEDYTLKPSERRNFSNGFAAEIPAGYGAFVMDKGRYGNSGIKTLGGVIDAGYRGEYNVDLINLSDADFEIKEGDKIAQIVILPVERAEIEEVDELSESARGEGRFGSTGTH